VVGLLPGDGVVFGSGANRGFPAGLSGPAAGEVCTARRLHKPLATRTRIARCNRGEWRGAAVMAIAAGGKVSGSRFLYHPGKESSGSQDCLSF
ncbi:MAG TPA: hypothetical protein DIC23_16210, partial [Planctomycetaceae bacterium]|nr:hypothetical protein [Planctomycetaceae bacterium]